MGSLFSLSLIYLSLSLLLPPKAETLEIKTGRVLDSVIRDYILRSYYNNTTTFKTGKLYNINLPSNLSGINVDTIRLRCGSLQRYGAKVKEFYISSGVNVHQCIERVILVRQSVESNWSSIYYNTYELSGYELISPILGLIAYNVGGSNISTTPTELGAQAGKKKITIDFSNTTLLNTSSRINPLCASFDLDGKLVSFANQERPNVCVATRLQGHVGLVVESPLMPLKGKVSKAKIVVVSSIGATLGAFLLSLLVIAMFVNAKKKARMDELERRAYQEEALQVSMVGHVRAVTASGTRTAPTIEHDEYSRVRHS
ncbi:hypothetical protein C2S52_007066 [Perilla frutescens var. hirtella]|nr:hypothetical protein C2S52_007066 [Perilla frutescens var. hirtella]